MDEFAKFKEYESKLQKLCEEKNLLYTLECSQYPITLIITKNQFLQQPSLFEQTDESNNMNVQASVRLYFVNGDLQYEFSRIFVSDKTMARIKSLFKNIHYYWLQFFFREVLEKQMLIANQMPGK